MADDPDPWKHTRALLGDDFFDRYEPDEEQVRAAFEAELQISHAEERPFSVLGFLAGVRGSGLEEIGPGTFIAHKTQPDDGNGGWVSGAC